ncbi:MAG: hypothetical protein P8J87_18390, partial [Verrucomicrobiales bacterium]|nr:hypothetical protein [Verrucomicrobiales bacterium]
MRVMIGRCEWSGCLGVGLLVLVGCGGGREGGGERTGMGREFPGEAPGGIESRPLVDRAGQWAGGEGERGVIIPRG